MCLTDFTFFVWFDDLCSPFSNGITICAFSIADGLWMHSCSSCAKYVIAIFPSVNPPHDLLLRSTSTTYGKSRMRKQHKMFKLGLISRQKASSCQKTINSFRLSSFHETVSCCYFGSKALTSLCVQWHRHPNQPSVFVVVVVSCFADWPECSVYIRSWTGQGQDSLHNVAFDLTIRADTTIMIMSVYQKKLYHLEIDNLAI